MAQLPKGGLVRGHDKRIHGSCAIYFPGGFLCWWLFGPCLFYGYTPLCSRVYYKLYPIIGNPYEKTLSQNPRFSHVIQAQRVAELLKELAVTRLGVGNSLQPQGESPNHRRRVGRGEKTPMGDPLGVGHFWGCCLQDGRPKDFFLATESFTSWQVAKTWKNCMLGKIPTFHFPVCSEICATWQMRVVCLS